MKKLAVLSVLIVSVCVVYSSWGVEGAKNIINNISHHADVQIGRKSYSSTTMFPKNRDTFSIVHNRGGALVELDHTNMSLTGGGGHFDCNSACLCCSANFCGIVFPSACLLCAACR